MNLVGVDIRDQLRRTTLHRSCSLQFGQRIGACGGNRAIVHALDQAQLGRLVVIGVEKAEATRGGAARAALAALHPNVATGIKVPEVQSSASRGDCSCHDAYPAEIVSQLATILSLARFSEKSTQHKLGKDIFGNAWFAPGQFKAILGRNFTAIRFCLAGPCAWLFPWPWPTEQVRHYEQSRVSRPELALPLGSCRPSTRPVSPERR